MKSDSTSHRNKRWFQQGLRNEKCSKLETGLPRLLSAHMNGKDVHSN